jgi:23S rRNA (cytosine1962-C5)-methyltransferase
MERARGWKVLNTFAYTGSLSVAAGLGGAEHVTTLDLSKPTVRWAQDNWELNGLAADRGRFISGDVFEWLPRLGREGRLFDAIILDPPSFSRGNKGSFSTSKDLTMLHRLAMELLAERGTLITSINSANVSWAQYEKDVLSAARELGHEYEVLSRIDLPETFPTPLSQPQARYLKGWILRRR